MKFPDITSSNRYLNANVNQENQDDDVKHKVPSKVRRHAIPECVIFEYHI